MPEYVEVRGGPTPNLVESGPLTAPGASPWMPLEGQGEHVFVCDIDAIASPVGSFVVEGRRRRKDGTFGPEEVMFSTASLAEFPKVGRLAGYWDVRLRCSAYTSGTFNLAITK